MVTRKDIAQKANVSVSVVSRTLNNSGYVDKRKKERILRIAEELGYHSNPVAMSLASQRTRQIMFFCKNIENPFNIELYEGMLEAAWKQDYMLVINGKVDYDNIKNIMVDGVILPDEIMAEIYMDMVGRNYYLPVVAAAFGNLVNMSKSLPLVECDLWTGGRMIMEYLWEKGHRKIALAMPFGLEEQSSRHFAWREFMRDELGDRIDDYYLGISKNSLMEDGWISESGGGKNSLSAMLEFQDNFFGKGELAAEAFCERGIDATAIVCFNDEMALGFYKRIRALGYRVPEDISIIGFDGIHSRKYTDILLTSLFLNPREIGKKCTEVLLDLIEGRKHRLVTQIPMRILEGDSVRTIKSR